MDNLLSKKWLIILIVVAAIAMLIAWIAFAVNDLGRKDITISTSPLAVDVKIDDKVYKHQQSGSVHKARVGSDVRIVLSREGFAETTITHTVYENDEDNIIYIALEPLTFEAQQILLSSEEAANHESVVTDSYLNLTKEMNEEFPILSSLPYHGRYFTMSQGLSIKEPNNPRAFAIYIDIFSQFAEQGRADALELLDSKGYDPEDFEIIFREEKYRVRGD